MTKIKAPYNFVPLADKVVYPEWEKAVNHDVPFADSESGTISVRIKTHSPIFVKNGGEMSVLGRPDNFFESNGDYYIPGSSIKGMLRSVMEVMSFGKIGKNNVNDDRYSVRDFQNKDIYPMLDLAKEVNAAWLYKEGDKYYMQDCEAPGRIPHHWIDEFYKTNFRSFYKTGGGFQGNNEEHKSAEFKYNKFGDNERTTGFEKAIYGKDNSVDVRKFYKIDPYSKNIGTLVFAGQAGPRKEVPKGGSGKPSGKIHEFIFFETNNKAFELDDSVIKNFFFAYFDHDRNRQSIDWKYWKIKLDNNEKIPVFFRYDNRGKVKDMGLSYLYKIIYKNAVLDAIPYAHKEERRDFSETIFGYIDNKQSLKGRVHIGHAKVTNTAKSLPAETSVLSGPKASYYPNYIRQNGKNGKTQKYNTFMDDSAVIAGWKRYPIHKNGIKSNPGSTDNSKVETSFIPLNRGVEFEFKISVHNLRMLELGAIFSALTFHNTKGTFHSLGMAKPLGYGKTTFEITSINGFENDKPDEYMKIFEAYMNYAIGNNRPTWHSSPQIVELLTMVSEHDNAGKSELAYMKMDPKSRENDFIDAKDRTTGGGDYLDDYSNLVEKAIYANSLVADLDILNVYRQEKELEEVFDRIDLGKAKKLKFTESKNEVVLMLQDEIKKVSEELNSMPQRIDELIKLVNDQLKRGLVSGGLESFCEIKKKDDFKKFKGFENIVKQYLKNAKELNEGDLEFVINNITNIYKSSAKFEKKQFEKKYVKGISKWIGKQATQKWYDEMQKNQY